MYYDRLFAAATFCFGSGFCVRDRASVGKLEAEDRDA